MRAIQAHITATDFLRKDNYIAHIGLGDHGHPFNGFEIRRSCQCYAHAMARVGTVGEQVIFTLHGADAHIFHTKFFIFSKSSCSGGRDEGFRTSGEGEAIGTFRLADDGSAIAQVRPEQHDISSLMFHDAGVMYRFYRVRNVMLR